MTVGGTAGGWCLVLAIGGVVGSERRASMSVWRASMASIFSVRWANWSSSFVWSVITALSVTDRASTAGASAISLIASALV